MTRLIGVLGVTYRDAENVIDNLDIEGDKTPLSLLAPNAARGLVLDVLFISPSANRHPKQSAALDVITPALATRKALTGANNGGA